MGFKLRRFESAWKNWEMKHKIVFLHEFPSAKKFCVDYVKTEWGISLKEAEELVIPCLSDNEKLPFGLLVLVNKAPISLLFAVEHSDDVSSQYSPWLVALYVKEEFRKQGIGRELVKRACDELKKRGYEIVYIDTVSAQNFYKKLGWTFVEDVKWRDEKTSIFSINL